MKQAFAATVRPTGDRHVPCRQENIVPRTRAAGGGCRTTGGLLRAEGAMRQTRRIPCFQNAAVPAPHDGWLTDRVGKTTVPAGGRPVPRRGRSRPGHRQPEVPDEAVREVRSRAHALRMRGRRGRGAATVGPGGRDRGGRPSTKWRHRWNRCRGVAEMAGAGQAARSSMVDDRGRHCLPPPSLSRQ